MEITTYLQNKISLWERGNIEIIDGLDFNAYDNLKKIVYFTESKYLSGQKDARGKLKPFFNVVNYRVNVAVRATDIDTKDIRIEADEPQFMGVSFMLQKEVYNWMKQSNFAKTLNEMGYTRAKFGGVLVKKCVYDDGEGEELELEVVDWRNVIVDPSDPASEVIEKHYLTAQQLSEKRDVWDNIDEAIELAQKSDNGRLEVYEITANLPKDMYAETSEEDENTVYKLQKFYVYNKGKRKQSCVLYHEFIKDNPYKYLAWEHINGRLGRGIVEDSFEAQIWINDAVIKEKEAMEIGSKVVFTTTDPNIQNNVLSEVQNGQIIKRAAGTEFSTANMMTNAMPQFRQLVQSWDSQLDKTTSTFNAITGETMPSNTPYRTTAILNQEATSNFDYRREEMGIFLVEIFTDWIIPFLIKDLSRKHILSSDFSAEELAEIDDSFANYRANQMAEEMMDKGQVIYKEEYLQLVQANKELLRKQKEHRFIEIPEGYYKNFEPKVTIVTTGEQKNKAMILESLNNVMLTVARAPQILTDPTLSKVFAKILEVSGSGISPVSLGMTTTGAMQEAPLPQVTEEAMPAPMTAQ